MMEAWMVPHLIFVFGVVIGEVYQWGKWIKLNKGKPYRGYWQVGLPHLMTNAIIVYLVNLCWAEGWLDDAINLAIPDVLAGKWADVGIPFTPQLALPIGFVSDVFGDQLTFFARRVIGKRFPSLMPAEVAAAPAPEAPAGGTP